MNFFLLLHAESEHYFKDLNDQIHDSEHYV